MSQTTTPKFFCFVLMPFDAAFDDVYRLGIKEACISAGAYCERVDEQIFQERILDRIYNQIAKADLVIADMTNRNPNVFYEVGYAHALGKPAILLTKQAEDIPFDLKHFPHIVYGQSIASLRENLAERVTWFMTEAHTVTRGEFPIALYVHGHNLAKGHAACTAEPGFYPKIELTIENRSNSTLSTGSFKVGVVCDDNFPDCYADGVRTIKLPSGQYLHILQPVEYLFPGEIALCTFTLRHSRGDSDASTPVTIRVFTDAEVRDFPLMIHERVAPPEAY